MFLVQSKYKDEGMPDYRHSPPAMLYRNSDPFSGRCSCGDLEACQSRRYPSVLHEALTQVEVVVLGVTEEDQTADNVDQGCFRGVSHTIPSGVPKYVATYA